jgi:hypothetical protein
VALCPVVSRARFLVREQRAEEVAERRRANNADLVVNHVGAVELRAVAAAVPTVAADAVLVAHHLQKFDAHLVKYRTDPPACAQYRAKKQPGGG